MAYHVSLESQAEPTHTQQMQAAQNVSPQLFA